MAAQRLQGRLVERIWGTRSPPEWANCPSPLAGPVGEIWFEGETPQGSSELLVKYLFTKERLSVQVHPDDEAALSLGQARGKSEAWLVLEAEMDAIIGLGLKTETSKASLKAAALSGAIEDLIEWRPVSRGDFIFAPAGTVHAIGAGLALIEIQQNLDMTYRLYDYGRPRALHLDAGVEAAVAGPWRPPAAPQGAGGGREILHAGEAFVVERWTRSGRFAIAGAVELLLIPLTPGGTVDGQALDLGEVWRIDGRAELSLDNSAEIIAAYPGIEARALLEPA